jgi:hypothetical protein
VSAEFHVGDAPKIVRQIVDDDGSVVDVSSCAEAGGAMTITMGPQGGSYTEYDAELYTDGADGKIVYECDGSELTSAGSGVDFTYWWIEAWIQLSNGKSWTAMKTAHRVYEVLASTPAS